MKAVTHWPLIQQVLKSAKIHKDVTQGVHLTLESRVPPLTDLSYSRLHHSYSRHRMGVSRVHHGGTSLPWSRTSLSLQIYDDVMTWPFVAGIHRSPVGSTYKGPAVMQTFGDDCRRLKTQVTSFEMLTVRWQQHSFSTHKVGFLWKCQSFWDRKCLDLRWTRSPNLRIHVECSNHLSYQAQAFAVPYCWILALTCFFCKVNIWNVNCARATAFIYILPYSNGWNMRHTD